MKHTISVLVENKFGVLARIAGLFSARGFNISSLAVGETEDPAVSRMTIVVDGDEKTLEQIKKQLNKLIDTIKVVDFKKGAFIGRELVLVKVASTGKAKEKIAAAVKAAGASIVKETVNTATIEFTGDEAGVGSLLEALKPLGILEVVRTGRVAIGLEDKELVVGGGKPEVNE